MKKIFTACFILFSLLSFSQSTTVVISQVYPGGGSSSTTVTYKNDYVELHNISSVVQDISGFSLQYGSATGNFGNTATQIFAIPAGTTIPAGGYLLIPVTPDLSSTNLSMGAASGKVALVNNSTALGCGATATTCTLPAANIIDLVSYGASNNAEGGVTVNNGVALPSNTNGCVRKTNGCTETDNNNADFEVIVAPVPRNSASPVFLCGSAPVPSLSVSALPAFGNVCINTSAGPNSFTITGSNLTSADVTVAALAGYTYSTTAGGTYTTTLNITQPGGAFSQQVFVKFDPVAVQSYNGNIAVAGGGVTTAINAAASGAGVNTIPSLTTGSATAITQVSATLAGTITATGCTPVTVYGIEYSTTSGFPNGSGIQVASTNISGGNYTSALAGLTSGTTFYYKAYATNAGGTGYGTEQSFTTATPNPTINTTALTAFGNVCTNVTAGPNSFTISGANLTTADVTVGPLAGFTFSTTAGGTYTVSLSLTQPGGTYSQDVFVKFTPVAVQSYSGDIPVAGGGVAATVNVSASGAGVNTSPSVSTGGASAITTTTASLAGTISAIGCTSVTVYGIEYSATNGFPNGSGIQVVSTNISGGNFTSGLSGLIPSTTYYYKAFATNAGGTTYGVQQSFTTAAPPPPVLTATALTPFGNACITTTAGPNSFTINGANLTAVPLSVGPLTGYTFSETSGGTYVTTLAIAQTGGTQSKTVFVKFTPTAVQSYNGNIPVSGGGAPVITVAASGSGVNTLATVITGAATGLTTQSAVLAGSVSDNGCSNVTTYGIEYSGVNGFANGTGIQVASSNLTGGNFTISLPGLVQGATYYYKAYAVNNGGISYGLQQSFTVLSINPGFSLYPSPAVRGTDVRLTMTDLTPGYYGLLLFSSNGQLVFQRNMNIQAGFINQAFTIPATLSPGVYTAYLVNHLITIGTRTILVQ